MLRLHRAQRASTLADALADVMRTPLDDPFDREVVAVPARGVERWLSQRLSASLGAVTTDGIAANIAFPSSAALVAQVLAAASGLDRDDDPWAPDHLVWTVLDVIDESLGLPWAATLARHLGADPDRSSGPSHRNGRRYATAAQVAELFRRYGANRPAMVVSWSTGADTDETGLGLADDLVWQAELWRRVRERTGIPSPAERLQPACARIRDDPQSVELPARVSIFGVTRLTTDQLHVLDALATQREVHLWLPHPSAAMWETLAATSRCGPVSDAAYIRRADDTTALAVGHPLLASLSRDVRELQLRLARFEYIDILHRAPAGTRTLLGRIQADIDRDVAPAPNPAGDSPGSADPSIQIHACHGPPRQVEVLRESLLHLFQEDPRLEPRDVLVMCPDVETYAPLIQAVFGQPGPVDSPASDRGYELHPGHRLRVRLADRGLRETNPVLDVAAAVLALADGRVTASEVLDLAARAPVRRQFGFSDDDLERLRGWTTASGVRWGIGRRQRQAFGLGEVRQNTWNAAVDRILLGVTAEETESKWLGLALPLDDVDSNDIDLAGRLAELIDRLAVVLGDLQGPQSARAWTDALARAIDLLVDVAPDQTGQVAQASRELSGASQHSGETALGLSDVRSMLAYRLAGRPTRANFRTGELTVCTMVPMRSVPHRVVALLGLDDEVFPRGVRLDGDDILARDPCLGERDPGSEDRQLLLDALLSADKNLLIFYTGADPVNGTIRPPAIALGEVLDVVASMTGPGGSSVTRHPLQPFDPRNFRLAGPFSFDRDALAGARAQQGVPGRAPTLLGVTLPAATGDVSLVDLISFVVHPGQAFLRQRLGIRIPAPNDDIIDALSIELDGLGKWDIGDRMLAARITGVPMKDLQRVEWLRGSVPPLRLGATMLDGISRSVEALAGASIPVHVGPPATIDIEVDLGAGRRLTGTVTGGHGRVLASTSYSTLSWKHRLTAWVNLLAVACGSAGRRDPAGADDFSDPPESQPWRAITTGRGRNRRPLARSTLVAPPDALGQLRRLVDLRDRGLTEILPIATGASAQYAERRLGGGTVAEALDAAQREWNDRFGDVHDRHLAYLYGRSAPFDYLTRQLPRGDEAGWSEDPTRFGVLAVRIWGPLLRAESSEVR